MFVFRPWLLSIISFIFLQVQSFALPGLSDPIADECQKDIVSLAEKNKCSEECHDESPMDCLQENIKEISEACRKKIEPNRKDWEEKKKSFAEMKKSCVDDFKKHDIKGLCHKDTIFNLMVKKKEISKACKEATNKHIKAHTKHLLPMD
ncbi:MAG: hypothetical protein ACOH5I_14885 [Oligoflexus sp.]